VIAIVDYGMGNLGSTLNMLKKLGVPARITSVRDELEAAEKVIIPGVGAFDQGMEGLEERGLAALLRELAARGRPILGICLGMQLMTATSEEGNRSGLGLIDGTTVRIQVPQGEPSLKVPHMGWNTVRVTRPVPPLDGLAGDARFYFVHSYHVVCHVVSDVAAVTHHGCELTAAFVHGRLAGVQFHPERSHRFGMAVLRSFAERF
jgi:glutamine amidotransferase